MSRSFSSEVHSSLFGSRESSTEPSSIGLVASEFRFSPHDELEPRSEGYDEYFDPPLESKYECPICLLGLREPVQTSCGHRFCRGCIVRSIRDAGPKCPVDNERLTESQLYPDNFAKREMMNHNVFCRMKKQRGCPWKGPLGKLEEHLEECLFVDVNCPNKCGKQLQKKDLKQHLEKDCPLRTIPCKYCKENIQWNKLEDHYGRCPQFPTQCDQCKKENIPRGKMAEHLEKECPVVEVQCPFIIVGCTFEGRRSEVNKHVNEMMASHSMDMAKKLGEVMQVSESSQAGAHRSAPQRRPRGGGMESHPQEQASQEGYLHELSSRTQHQRDEIDELRRIITALTNSVHHLERQLEEARMRQERPVQELTMSSQLDFNSRAANER